MCCGLEKTLLLLLGEKPDGRSGIWGRGECGDEDGGEREVDGETVRQIGKGRRR